MLHIIILFILILFTIFLLDFGNVTTV